MTTPIKVASGARHGLSYIKEVAPGITPANPQLIALRHTGCSLNISRDNFQSNELRSDRMIPFVRTGCNKIGGSIDVEISFGEFDTFLEGVLGGTWANDSLKAGTQEHSYTFQRAFENINQYEFYRGSYINQWSLSIKPNAMITGSFEVVGLSGGLQSTPLCAAPTASQDGSAFDSYTGSLKESGTEIAIVTGVDLTLNNGIEPVYGLFKKNAALVEWKRSNLSGTMTALFTDAVLMERFLNESPASLEITLERHGDSYSILIPNITYTGSENNVSGEGSIQLSMPWIAALDATVGSNIQITRKPRGVTPPVPPISDPDPEI